MIDIAIVTVALILIGGVFLAVRRARRRRNYNPNDIYPLW
jgi:hypothetical protein